MKQLADKLVALLEKPVDAINNAMQSIVTLAGQPRQLAKIVVILAVALDVITNGSIGTIGFLIATATNLIGVATGETVKNGLMPMVVIGLMVLVFKGKSPQV